MKYHKLVENAAKPKGFWGRMMIKSMNKNHSELTDWGLEHINIQCNSNILDIGCGGGRTVNKLCKKAGNGKVYGVDYSALCVKKSKKYNSKNILCKKAVILQASVSKLPFDSNKFDYATAVETYYFWKDKINDLREIKRVLKPGGKLLLVFEMLKTDDNPFKWDSVEQTLNIKAVSEEEIYDMLEIAGYQNIQVFTKENESWLCAIAEKQSEE